MSSFDKVFLVFAVKTLPFITHIANQHICTKVQAEKTIDMFISSVIDAMRQGNEISFVGFGKFYTTKIKARTGRNPRTGDFPSICVNSIIGT
ncbi:HU family DNA-binding protein [Candidatus Megaera venefica]|uniref:HU family DNA-binding protein n=1 Tax=Candidatus Megaera venefica TaxID=2055910 RepID=A0ABU5NF14_9RICK|nr:HU family DNA-binding protein [Candidatus Megaera venefica]